MIKNVITEISEADFRRLGLKGIKSESVVKTVEVLLADELDAGIAARIEGGWPEDLEALTRPVTVAVHEPAPEGAPAIYGMYLDKFMNAYTGARSYQIGFGIPHLYSARNWFEARDGDYWRVAKHETAAVYRIRLDPKWSESFELRHRVRREPWPEGTPVPWDGAWESAELAVTEDLEDGGWKERFRTCELRLRFASASIPVGKDNKRK